MEGLKKLKVKPGRKQLRIEGRGEKRLGGEGENPQRVVVPNDDDDDVVWCKGSDVLEILDVDVCWMLRCLETPGTFLVLVNSDNTERSLAQKAEI